MKALKHTFIFAALLLLGASSAQAKLFRNAYVQFELPQSWNCNLEGSEWVCSSQNKIDSKESIIILTAKKEVGPQDSFQTYEKYLKTPKTLTDGKRPVMSQVKSVRQRKINEHPWIDALHLGSEIPGYYTRYLATIKDKLAILVTLSAHQKYYTKYSNDYFKAVESLRVVASKDLFAPRALAPIKPGGENYGGAVNPSMPLPGSGDMAPPPEAESDSGNDMLLVGLGLIILAIAAYIFVKRR